MRRRFLGTANRRGPTSASGAAIARSHWLGTATQLINLLQCAVAATAADAKVATANPCSQHARARAAITSSLVIRDRQHFGSHSSRSCSMAAMMSGRPLLVQPFTSLCSMSMPQCCLPSASIGLCQTHVAVQNIRQTEHALHCKLSAARSTSAGSHGTVCSALPVCGGTVSPYRSTVASAAELPAPRAEQISVQPDQSQLSVRQHQLRRPASTAVIGWRVRDISAMDQDIGIVTEV